MAARSLPRITETRRQLPGWVTLLLVAIRRGRGRAGIVLVAAVVLLSAVGPFVAPHDPNAFVARPFADPSGSHLFGTDNLGRDVLSRVLHGGWRLLLMAGLATVLGVALGAAVGILAAFKGGTVGAALMRGADMLLAFPQLVFALLLVSVAGPKVWLIVLAVALAHAPQVARVMRAAALDVVERDFVSAAELFALRPSRIMAGEVLPNVTTPLMVEFGLRLTYSIMIIAALSFLGFGLAPPDPSWGTMIGESRVGIAANAVAVLGPVFVIGILTIGVNFLTDAVGRAALGLDKHQDGGSGHSDPVAEHGMVVASA